MKILCVNMSIDPVTGGGTAERTVQMAIHLKKLNYSCAILTLNIGNLHNQLFEHKDIRIFKIPCFWRRFYLPLSGFSIISKAINR